MDLNTWKVLDAKRIGCLPVCSILARYLFVSRFCHSSALNSAICMGDLQSCLDDFTHHNIDVACNLLETSGRFLYRFPDTALRMGNMLDIIMRLKNVKNLDARHSTLVENAYYQCKPPERSARVSKVRPPLHQVGIYWVILSSPSYQFMITLVASQHILTLLIVLAVHSEVAVCRS